MAAGDIGDLAGLRARLAALDEAMASGVLTLRDGEGSLLTYRSYKEMRQARADILSRINELGSSPRSRSIRIRYSKGW